MDSTFKTASSIKHIDKKWPLGGATKPLNGREFSLDNFLKNFCICVLDARCCFKC